MKIVVAVKQVAALDDDFEIGADGMSVDPDFLEWELNEWDSFSVEEALRIRESAGGGELVLVSVGDEQARDGIHTCLAMGADRAIRVWDESLVGADALAVARTLAAVIARESPDLVFCGVQSSDAVYGATGIALAHHLGLPHVAVVKRLEYDPETCFATVHRELEGGLVEVVELTTPALFTIQTGINEPRYANLRAIKHAVNKPTEELSLGEIGLDAEEVARAAGATVRSMRSPERGQGATMLEGSPAEIAGRIMDIVKQSV
jgi:electron transfer flavoprotein beta subunit